MGFKTYQEKNAKPMGKESAQSDIPVKRKIQKTIKKCHPIWPVGGLEVQTKSFIFPPNSFVMVNYMTSKTLHSFRENKTPNRPNYFLDFPIIGPQKNVVVNFIYGYQNLSGEKYKSNGKRISSIRHTSEEKNPKKHPKIPNFRKVF